jgi:hypothetical protein
MPKRTPQDWEILERELHAAGVSPVAVVNHECQRRRVGCP